MAMEPGNQAITGGTVLRIPAIQSPNYVPGVSGWIIRQDGSAEFNKGTFRVSLTVGPNPGAHITLLDSGGTGDALDVYNNLNQLVLSIDAQGAFNTFVSGVKRTTINQSIIELLGYSDSLGNTVFGEVTGVQHAESVGNTAGLALLANTASPTPNGTLYVLASDSAFGATVVAQERAVQGSVVVSDQLRTNNLVHMVPNLNITSGATGLFSYAHGLGFTPTGAIAVINSQGSPVFANFSSFTSTTANGSLFFSSTGGSVNNVTLPFNVFYFG